MRRLAFMLLFTFALVLVGCGGSGDTTVTEPPQSTAIESTDNAKIDQLLADLRQTVPAEMQAQKVVPNTIEQHVYRSTASLDEIAAFYDQLTENGWRKIHRMPGLQDNILLSSYDNGNTSLIVTAFDAQALDGEGVIIYTAKGTKE